MHPSEQDVRPAELAGAWYPATSAACLRAFGSFEQRSSAVARTKVVAGIVPHAGWSFSGSIAYHVLREIARHNQDADTVLLFAGHLRPSSPSTIMGHGACWTPLGLLQTDEPLAQALGELPHLRVETPAAHSQDNSAEVVFPLLKHFFPQARVLVLGAPPRHDVLALAEAIMNAAENLERKVVALGSTDLTHYGPTYGFTPRGVGGEALRWVTEVNDPLFIEAVCSGAPTEVLDVAASHHNACCPGAVAATMHCAGRLGVRHAERLRYQTSADIRPAVDFVGYAGILF